MKEDLEGRSLDRVLRSLERGRIGRSDAMEYLHIDSLHQFVEIMHCNGRLMPGHQPMKLRRGASNAIAAACALRADGRVAATEAAK